MNLYLMRHGIAIVRGAPGIHSDRDRHLTEKGIKRLRRAGKGLSTLNIPFDRILTSPFERARQTAEIVADVLKMAKRLEEIPELTPEGTVKSLLSALAPYRNDRHVLLVGHEPLLSEAASFLLSETREIEIRMKKGGICSIEVDNLPPKEPGILHWMLAPRQLRLLAGQ